MKKENHMDQQGKKCVHRKFSGFCQKHKTYVPKKQKIDGTNPCAMCEEFKRKKDK